MSLRVGIDLGGTKIAGMAFDAQDNVVAQARQPTPREDYAATIACISAMVAELAGSSDHTVGIGIPGSVSSLTGQVQNANSTWINGKPFHQDLEAVLGGPVRLANDANCLALSEAADGAGASAHSVFAVILGTGCGGGFVLNGGLNAGPHAIGGEWGHNPLPWPNEGEHPGPNCWCGKHGCLETWIAGPSLARDHLDVTGKTLSPEDIADQAKSGDQDAQATLDRHLDRTARGLAHVVNLLDPEIIVIGGGLVALPGLVDRLPGAIARHVFADAVDIKVAAAHHGPASGVRGAARLWDEPQSCRSAQ
jgi:fructokinase